MNVAHPIITVLQNKRKQILYLPATILFMVSCSNREHNWSAYKADAASSSYSDLKEINDGNVMRLSLNWTFNPNDAAEGSRLAGSQCNPIVVNGIMYAASARHRIYAINASNGKPVWSFDPFNGGPGGGSFRGVTYWEDGTDKRILFTGGDNLFALDAVSGKPITAFGTAGKVSMNIGIRDNPDKISVKPTSPGIVYKDLLIMGNEVSELYGAQPGYIRAYNIRNGKLEWTFHTIPKPGETGYDTWPENAWKYAGGANDWGGMSLDVKRGMVFLATGSPSYDFYGYDRIGKNLFGNCVVALHAATGKYIWHFQTVHHDLWDYDLPAPPNLVTVEKDGKQIDAVAQTSKVGFLYVLNRETGEPLFPVEERPVPASDVPGEQAWPTQPFPLKPKPYSRQFMTVDDLSNFSTASHDSLVRLFTSLRYEGLFTPPSLKGTLNLPGTIGGSEWGGAAFDPGTGILYLKANESPEIDMLQKIDPENNTSSRSLHENGKNIYTLYCAGCHRADRKGDEPLYPSLVDLDKRMTGPEALSKIKDGAGKMPPFAHIIKGHEEEILNFLFNKTNGRQSQKQADLEEIRRNRLSNIEVKKGTMTADTSVTYLNVLAYSQLKDPEGRPAIRPPWGTLHAINLSTGEYEWTIPVGNHPDLQKKGEPVTGATGSPGPIVTAGGLVFLGGSRDRSFQAFDKKSGKLLWQATLPGFASSSACTYRANGKQYIAVSVAGSKDSPAGSIMAFALPD
jgi:quinoprotein glucose dehydrogenase